MIYCISTQFINKERYNKFNMISLKILFSITILFTITLQLKLFPQIPQQPQLQQYPISITQNEHSQKLQDLNILLKDISIPQLQDSSTFYSKIKEEQKKQKQSDGKKKIINTFKSIEQKAGNKVWEQEIQQIQKLKQELASIKQQLNKRKEQNQKNSRQKQLEIKNNFTKKFEQFKKDISDKQQTLVARLKQEYQNFLKQRQTKLKQFKEKYTRQKNETQAKYLQQLNKNQTKQKQFEAKSNQNIKLLQRNIKVKSEALKYQITSFFINKKQKEQENQRRLVQKLKEETLKNIKSNLQSKNRIPEQSQIYLQKLFQ